MNDIQGQTPQENTPKRRFSIRNIVLGLFGTGAIAALVFAVLAPASSATFVAKDTGNVSVSTAHLTLSLTDDNGSQGEFNLAFNELAPGANHQQAQRFYVTNTGTVAAAVKIGQPVTVGNISVPPGQNPNPSQLSAGIDGYLNMGPVTAVTSDVALGNLAPGETRSYIVRVELDQAADNNWQNVAANGSVTVTLTGL